MSAMLERLAHPAIRERIRHDLARDGLNNFGRIPSWDVVRLAGSPSHPADAGLDFGALAPSLRDAPRIVSSTVRLRSQVGFRPRVSLDDGLQETIDWWRRRDAAVGAT